MTTGVVLDWAAIRPLNGSRAHGFEELCAQLARAELPTRSRFERKGTPDAGVECYAVLADNTEWGWQAKYFDVLGESQWSQLDESVKTVIEKHPHLVKYHVCVPLDRPDARVEGRKSAKERWDDHVTKWTGWASNRGMTVEFVYWGSHELLDRLSGAQHVGRIRFWFDVRGFDGAWFSARLDEALKTAGPRYTPEIHVDLPIAAELDALGRTEGFFDRVKAQARTLRETSRHRDYGQRSADPALSEAAVALLDKLGGVIAGLSSVEIQASGPLPFKHLADLATTAETSADDVEHLLEEREREWEITSKGAPAKGPDAPSYRSNPFRDLRHHVVGLSSELRTTRTTLAHADRVAGAALMLLRGDAGTGKTHLLCDVARQRVNAHRPTVLLMGQRFVSNEAPWTQALQQLDLAGSSAEEFVGALEAAAQAANCRALVLVDAINEGTGRTIWPSHLAAFLAHVERSPWIAVVLSVRTSYEKIVVPDDLRARSVIVTHAGFAKHEYDATKTFFIHYGLELPSTPLLAPEFRNPLFLKTLCRGLQGQGEHRLPRGFHGVTSVFDLYLGAINERLATSLGYNPKDPLVRRGLEAIASTLADSEERWLTVAKAAEIVNACLPGRDFERSLYRGLVVEGVLVEEPSWRSGTEHEEIAFVAYERFADHFVAKVLLDRHLDMAAPATTFAPGGALAFVSDETHYMSPGLLEALCVQIPERTGREFLTLAPTAGDRWGLADAFRQSLVWRSVTAFSDDTRGVLNAFYRSDQDVHDTVDVLLTVATIPGHPFNATFLDARLRRDAMPTRDTWWSTSLHVAWGAQGAVDRLVDWASSVVSDNTLEADTVDLCATTLGWVLTTSNRFLRDRATQALVTLLTGRLDAVERLVDRFADVDDLYVRERVYAVAYGTAVRSHDPIAVGRLAGRVYTQVFSNGPPPPHILLRDYARGVVERALHLGCELDVSPERIRPPYGSPWPTIPTDEDVKSLLPDWSRGDHDSRDIEWARNRIGGSIMHDDFAHYVIGTNSSSESYHWLSSRLGTAATEPTDPDELLASMVSAFSAEELEAWQAFQLADVAHDDLLQSVVTDWFRARNKDSDIPDVEVLAAEIETVTPPELGTLEGEREKTLASLKTLLQEERSQRLEAILASQNADNKRQEPDRLDLKQIQRYVLWRVFDLGWTTKLFGHFDRFSVGHDGREASKAERIGKKYQWLAYHEILALVADNFQYRERYRNDKDAPRSYEGPWQIHVRDIDPSCTLRSTPGGNRMDGHPQAWWSSIRYEAWGDPERPDEWALRSDDLPRIADLLLVTDPHNGSRWLNAEAFFNWKQRGPADRPSTDVERREIWCVCTGYLIPMADAAAFLGWAEGVDFWGRWMPHVPEVHELYLGEHGWAPAYQSFHKQYLADGLWAQPDHGCPTKIRTVASEYMRSARGLDCSVDESYSLRLPAGDIAVPLEVRWTGSDADFVDSAGQLAVFDPTTRADGPSALLLRLDTMHAYLARENLTLCWAVLGEKRVLGAGFGMGPRHTALRMSGAYVLDRDGLNGFLKCGADDPSASDEEPVPVTILRTPTVAK